MSRSDAISALSRAVGSHEMAIVEGTFDCAVSTHDLPAPHSSLDRLCEWLDLPRVAVVDVRLLAERGLTLRPKRIDGVLLDRVHDAYDAAYWQTTLETLWKTPVVGWLDEAPAHRAACLPSAGNTQPSREHCDALAQSLLPTLRLDRLTHLARRAGGLPFEPEAWLLSASERRFRIAVAIDEVFCGYYPETLDLLEASGAELCDFSPLRSEAIPEDAAIVYLGCGHPERYAERLAANHCLQQSLRSYAAAGGRIYAEGGGLAYLCRELVLPAGVSVPMTGLLPATAHWRDFEKALEPAEVTFGLSSWLAPARVSLRGYRNRTWQVDAHGPMLSYAAADNQSFDLVGQGNVIGSRVLINLAANRHLLRRFFEPHVAVAAAVRRPRD
jgi:cobyrinic acid a,c-diamide synthase